MSDIIDDVIKNTSPELAEEIEKAQAVLEDDVFTLAELEAQVDKEGKDDPNELIKNRFLCRKGGAILAAQTGCGKSSFVMQMILNFALGRPCFGLEPKRELKTLLIQGENDQRDLYEEISGVSRGLRTHENLAIPQIEKAFQMVTVRTCTKFSGAEFIHHLGEVLTAANGEFDLLVIDPLFSFAGVDIGKEQGNLSQWLRNGFNTLLHHHNIGVFIVHHANKPSKAATPKDKNYNSAYDYAGSAELVNWARAMLILERFNDPDGRFYFRLSAPKRGTRLERDYCKYLCWATEGGIYWKETPPPCIPADVKESKESAKKIADLELARQAAKLLLQGEIISVAKFRNRISGALAISSHGKQEYIVSICVAQKMINRRPRREDDPRQLNGGGGEVVELPTSTEDDEPD